MRKKEALSARYTRKQLAASERYKGRRDLVMALLESGKEYSLQEVDAELEKYKKGKVR